MWVPTIVEFVMSEECIVQTLTPCFAASSPEAMWIATVIRRSLCKSGATAEPHDVRSDGDQTETGC